MPLKINLFFPPKNTCSLVKKLEQISKNAKKEKKLDDNENDEIRLR